MGKSNKYSEEDRVEECFTRAANQYNDECYSLFENLVRKLVKDTGLSEDEVRESFSQLI